MTLLGWVGFREPRGRLGGRYTKNVTIGPTLACTKPRAKVKRVLCENSNCKLQTNRYRMAKPYTTSNVQWCINVCLRAIGAPVIRAEVRLHNPLLLGACTQRQGLAHKVPRVCVGKRGGEVAPLLLLVELRVPLEQVLDLAAHEYAGDEQVAR